MPAVEEANVQEYDWKPGTATVEVERPGSSEYHVWPSWLYSMRQLSTEDVEEALKRILKPI